MKVFFLSRRFNRLKIPGAVLLALLQRTPALRVAAQLETVIADSPVANVIRSVLTAVASLGAIQSMAGATTLYVSSGTTSGVTATVGTALNPTVTFSVLGTQSPPASWTVSGTFPPGMDFSGLTASGIVNVKGLTLEGTPTTAGSYTVKITAWENSGGKGNSSPAYSYTVTVNGAAATAPTITTQPQSQTVTAGASVTFSVAATGSPTPTYQWQKGGTAISGATNTSYSIASAQAGDAATYTVVVTNSAGSVTSNGATLTVNAATVAPTITTQPQSQTVTAGNSVTFTVAATGTPAPTYQWQKGGTAISGATNTSYSIASAQAGDAATYTVAVTNSAGTVTSNGATLTVNAATAAPTITTQPQSQTVTTGSSVTFTVAATGTPAPTYQWRKGGAAISGATNASYSIASAQAGDAATYTVVVTNSAGTVTSNGATLTVNAATAAPTITTQPQSQTAVVGGTATFSVVATGTPTPTYQWQKGGTAVSGATSSSLTVSNAQTTDAGTYTVVVTNSVGSVTSSGATLTVTAGGTPPSFTLQPASETIAVGSSVAFNAIATGATSYRWQHNGADISGATSSVLIVRSTTGADAGSYTAIATGPGGSVTSTNATLTIQAASAADTGRVGNLSVMTNSGTGANELDVGFSVGGDGTSGTMPLLIRVAGPSLSTFGVPGLMDDPTLTVRPLGSTTVLAANDDWTGDATVTTVGHAVGAFPFNNASTKDAALVTSLDGGVYTAIAAGKSGATGIVLCEIYDATSSTNVTTTSRRLINVSARAQASSGAGVLTAGFAILGSTAKTVLIRAIGPGLGAYGVPGTLADPKLALYQLGGPKLFENDDWGGAQVLSTVGGSVGAFGIQDPASKDAMLLVTLPPGTYSAQVGGPDGTSGLALIEVYDVP